MLREFLHALRARAHKLNRSTIGKDHVQVIPSNLIFAERTTELSRLELTMDAQRLEQGFELGVVYCLHRGGLCRHDYRIILPQLKLTFGASVEFTPRLAKPDRKYSRRGWRAIAIFSSYGAVPA
jgi:hypothetical protein